MTRFEGFWYRLAVGAESAWRAMISAKKSLSPVINSPLERLQRHLEVWRKSHRPRSRLPGRFWNSAVQLAGQYGVNKTAKALRLDYYDLKKRVSAGAVVHETAPSFVELVPATSSPFPECLIELEARSGTKMRIHLKGTTLPDLTTLGSMFWRSNR